MKIITLFIFVLVFAASVSAVTVTEEWTANYTGTGNDRSYSIDVNSGVVAVGGYSINANGTGNTDYFLIKYDTDGAVSWMRNYSGSGIDEGHGVAVDSSGNVYITGFSLNAAGTANRDILTIKYNSAGVVQWMVNYTGSDDDEGYDIDVDSSGNVYVTGLSINASGNEDEDIFLIKYNSAGIEQWAVNYTGSGYDWGDGIFVDSSGNIYVTGVSENAAGNADDDLIVLKYNSAAALQWTANYSGTGLDEGFGIVTDSSDNVFVAGYSENAAGTANTDIFLIKYNSAGVLQWSRNYTGSGADEGFDIDIDSNGNLYVVGYSTNAVGGSSGQDVSVLKYNSSGSLVWQQNYTSTGNDADRGYGVKYDSGDVYVTGFATNTNTDFFTIKYNQSFSLSVPSDSFTSSLSMNGSSDGNLTDSGSYSTDQFVTFLNESSADKYLKVFAYFSQGDVDFSSLVIQSSGTKVSVDASGVSNINSSYTVYLPNTLSEGVYVCPSADLISEVTLACGGIVSFTHAQCIAGASSSGITCDLVGSDYVLSGMSGSGVGEGNPPVGAVPEFSTWAMMIALLGGFLGIFGMRKRMEE